MLHSLLEAISSRLESREKANRSLVSLLNSLAAHLQTHFEFEESDDFFANLHRRAPRLTSQVSQLQAEHREMLEEVDLLIELARIAFVAERAPRELANRYQAFRAKFREHEATESRLLEEANRGGVGE